MEDQIIRYLIPATGLISGLIGAFVGLQNRALLAEGNDLAFDIKAVASPNAGSDLTVVVQT